jgi:hypothetical protein
MKKTLLFFFFLSISLVGFAQAPTIGLKGGLNFATLQGSGTENNTVAGTNSIATSSRITSFNIGVFVDVKLGHFSLQPGVSFTGKGGWFYGYTGTLPNGSISNISSKYEVNYIQVPVNLVYHIPFVIGEVFVGAGPYVALGVNAKRVLNADNINDGQHTYLVKSDKIKFGDEAGDISPTDVGATGLAGIKLKGGFLLTLNYDLGLANILPPADGRTFKTRTFGASIGFAF